MGKSDDKSQVLGDDPLAWLNAGVDEDKNKKKVKKKVSAKKKIAKKAKPVKVESKKKSKAKQPKAEVVKVSNRFELDSSLVINKASDIYEALKKLDTNSQSVEIDASKVEVIDSAILQLFLSFALSLKEKDIKLSWYKPTGGLLNKASTLGLTEQLGL